MAAIRAGSCSVLVASIVVVVAKYVAGDDCLTGEACRNILFNTTINNFTNCCSNVNQTVTASIGQPCRCLTAEEEAKEKADSKMNQGRMCLFGEDVCGNAGNSYTTNSSISGGSVACCKNSMSVESSYFKSPGSSVYVCKCSNNTAPVLPPDAYVVNVSSTFKTSGEPCLYDALCDDEPAIACKGDSVVYCCYRSRGIHTTNLNVNTTGCTCTNEMFGAQCAADLKPVIPSQQRCLTNAACPAAANVVTSCANNVKVTYCCPNLLVKPHLQLIQGKIPKEMCTCRAVPSSGSQLPTPDGSGSQLSTSDCSGSQFPSSNSSGSQQPTSDGSGSSQVTVSIHLYAAVGLLLNFLGPHAGKI